MDLLLVLKKEKEPLYGLFSMLCVYRCWHELIGAENFGLAGMVGCAGL